MSEFSTFPSRFAAFAEAARLMQLADDNFIPVYASANIKVLPYQIAAARFALRSSYLKGCILCDEASLGKTYEALLIIAQKCHEGKGNILIVLPANLVKQWQNKIADAFALPFVLWKERDQSDKKKTIEEFFVNTRVDPGYYIDENQKPQRHLYIATYEEALQDAVEIEKYNWDLVVFDEADFLFKPENKSVITLKKAVGSAFKLLLTPTPITMSIMDIYGLIHFIDESVLPDAEAFYNRYFRHEERYAELSSWVSQFSFRTLKKQVEQYIGFSKRLPLMVYYDLSSEEQEIYKLIEAYLSLPVKEAYPEMEKYRLALLFYHTIASSPAALASMLEAPLKRSGGEENRLLSEMQLRALKIGQNSKAVSLSVTLKKIFTHLKSQKETQKAVVFVENLATLDVLYNFLTENGYNILKFKEEADLAKFRTDNSVQILLTTDIAAKGIDIEYCPVVVNYDLLYNALEMEQRICRCHRQGQKSDVLVVNMLNRQNMADVRVLELINKRTLQFGGIFGMSDDIVGNFDLSVDDVLKLRRRPDIIQNEIAQTLQSHREENQRIVDMAETSLFTTFTKEIADKVIVTPQYIAEKSAEVRDDLWRLVVYFLETNFPQQFDIDHNTQTIFLKSEQEAPVLFYHNQRAYKSNKKYGMAPDFKPEAGRITLLSTMAFGIFHYISCFSHGELMVDADIEPCEMSLYAVELRTDNMNGYHRSPYARGRYLKLYHVLRGKTKSGRKLSDAECFKLLSLPVLECIENGKKDYPEPYWMINNNRDRKVPEIEDISKEIIARYIDERQTSVKDDALLIQLKASRAKSKLEDSLSGLRSDIKSLRDKMYQVNNQLDELLLKKQIKTQELELKRKEEGLFLDQAQIDVKAENEIEDLLDRKYLFCEFYQLFNVQIRGK